MIEKQVWKFGLGMQDFVEIRIPSGAEFLHVAEQQGGIFLWALVDPDSPTKVYRFRVAGTGHPIGMGVPHRFIGTTMLEGGNLVFHIFEITE